MCGPSRRVGPMALLELESCSSSTGSGSSRGALILRSGNTMVLFRECCWGLTRR